MRHLTIIGPIMLLSACGASVESVRPLFAPGSDSFRPGMWAGVSIDKPCELPKDTAIFTWPDCAIPILFEGGKATYFAPGHVTVAFDVADGTPPIIQANRDIIGGWADSSDRAATSNPNRRFYASFYPASGTPFSAGRLQFLSCPPPSAEPVETLPRRRQKAPESQEKPIEGLRQVSIGNDTHCVADTPEAVRELARRASRDEATLRIVWIGDYP